jgi:DNA-binding NarL/FixJ family response regulator
MGVQSRPCVEGDSVHRVVVVDDHRVFAELMQIAVQAEPDYEVVGHAQSVTDGLTMVEKLRPDVVIMDVRLGDGDGIAATAELTQRHPDLRVIVLTAHVNEDLMRRAAAARACALLAKDGDLAGMLEVMRSSRRGAFAVDPRLLGKLVGTPVVAQTRGPSLTPREYDVLRMLATGLEARMIAREAGISVHTCRGHVKNILTKLEAHSQLEAVAKAVRYGLIDVHPEG